MKSKLVQGPKTTVKIVGKTELNTSLSNGDNELIIFYFGGHILLSRSQ